ncbi:MAG: ribosomal protein S18-alanine N-acetyltransferase [Gemmatimonadales bacterium]|jgi:ribosomal-protein-alanine N-acetyltransferase
MTVAIDRVRTSDVPAIVAIERAAFSDPWSARSFRDAIELDAVYFACARSDGDDPVGYVVAWFAADEGEIANLAVAPEGWGRGIGRALLDAALGEGLRRGTAGMYLEVRETNERARGLYRSRGFEEIGRRRRYYRRPVEDAIVLRRTLTGQGV